MDKSNAVNVKSNAGDRQSKIWSQNQEDNESAEWINEVKESLSERRKQYGVMIDAVKLRQQLGKLLKWKACDPENVHEFLD